MPEIEITEIHIHVCRNQPAGDPLLGFARVVLNGCFVVNGIRIIQSRMPSLGAPRRPHIAFPREKNSPEDKVFNICHPITRELQDSMCARIVGEYEEAIRTATAKKEAK